MNHNKRKIVSTLLERLSEHPHSMIFIAGPRQVGKTTLVKHTLSSYEPNKDYHSVSMDQQDEPFIPELSLNDSSHEQEDKPKDKSWLIKQWQYARIKARQHPQKYILVLDEIQKLKGWSEVVKGLWDFDRAEDLNLHVILLGSSPLLMQQRMTESLMGRYELIRATHWSYAEMQDAFDFDLEDYIYFGGYPGSARHIRDEARWRDYIRGSIINPSIETDILMMTRVDKPALLKQLFYLSCEYSGQLLAFDKIRGQLEDAGNTVTLAHYLELLKGAGLVGGIQKYANQQIRVRASVPKHNVMNMALMSANSGYTKEEAKNDRRYWGRMVESAIGAHLYNTCQPNCQVYYWRDGKHEVDFVIESGRKLTIVEVKSGISKEHVPGFAEFEKKFGKSCRKLLVGEKGDVSIIEFLSYPAEYWL